MHAREGDMKLYAAILQQAFDDATSRDRTAEIENAIRFIDEKNELFRFYCELLDLDPSYMAKNMQRKIESSKYLPRRIRRKKIKVVIELAA